MFDTFDMDDIRGLIDDAFTSAGIVDVSLDSMELIEYLRDVGVGQDALCAAMRVLHDAVPQLVFLTVPCMTVIVGRDAPEVFSVIHMPVGIDG